jgi:hypothetical protein
MRKRVIALVLAVGVATLAPAAQEPSFPLKPDSLKFAVVGDNGDGSSGEYDVARQMAQARAGFPFELVIMLGDNMYGRQQPNDFVDKFERPFAAILRAGVPFYAAIGNHDSPATLVYNGFNMAGQRYYTYARKNVRFFVLDTNILDRRQLSWLDENLGRASEDWKIAYFHHPLYSDGDRHGSNVELRVSLEPLFLKHGISVVFAAHDHVYERTTPQKGIVHFIEGSGGRLRKGGLTPSAMTAASFDQDQTFMLVEIAGDEMHFRAISRTGRTVDSGVIRRRPTT